jgi:hypothetical protein
MISLSFDARNGSDLIIAIEEQMESQKTTRQGYCGEAAISGGSTR